MWQKQSQELTRVNWDRKNLSINAELTSTFYFTDRGLVHHHHRILNLIVIYRLLKNESHKTPPPPWKVVSPKPVYPYIVIYFQPWTVICSNSLIFHCFSIQLHSNTAVYKVYNKRIFKDKICSVVITLFLLPCIED